MKTQFRTFVIIFSLILVTHYAVAGTYSLYVNKTGGDNSLSGRTYESAWKDFGFAISKILNEDYSSVDVVYLYLTNGPYHLGEEKSRLPESDFTVNFSPLENDRDGIPELIIIGWDNSTSTEKEQIITGINTDHRLEFIGGERSMGSSGSSGLSAFTGSNGGIYTFNWRPEEEYNFGWQRGATPAALRRYVKNNPDKKTHKWLLNTIENHYPNRAGGNTHFGIYMLRREMVVGIDTVSGEYYNYKPIHKEFIAEVNADENYYNVDYLVDPSEYNEEEWSVDYLSNDTANESFRPYSEWKVTINTTTDLHPDSSNVVIYAPILRRLFIAKFTERIELRSLSFRAANPFPREPAVLIARCNQVKIINSNIKHINGIGLKISHCTARSEFKNWWSKKIEDNNMWEYDDVLLQNMTIEDCGLYGMSINQSMGVTMDNCVLEGNNWLAYRAGTMSWACGALKAFQIRHVKIIGGESKDNYGYGFWIDQDGRDITFTDFNATGNYSAGLFLEISPGPINLIGGELRDNAVNKDQNIGNGPGVGPKCGLLLNSVSNIHIQGMNIDQSGIDNTFPVRVSDTERTGSRNMKLLWGGNVDQYMENNTFRDVTFNAPKIQDTQSRFIGTLKKRQFCRFWKTVEIEDAIWKIGEETLTEMPEDIEYWYNECGK